jgi:hypothetical protein
VSVRQLLRREAKEARDTLYRAEKQGASFYDVILPARVRRDACERLLMMSYDELQVERARLWSELAVCLDREVPDIKRQMETVGALIEETPRQHDAEIARQRERREIEDLAWWLDWKRHLGY